jgi:hypothetical protein
MLIECDFCNATVEAQLIADYTQHMEWDWTQSLKFSLCRCSQCSSPLLVKQEYEMTHEYDLEWGKPEKIYPNNLFHINPIIPEQLQKALLECIQCFRGHAYTATTIMCRRTIEGFCLLKGIREKSLDKSIQKLKENGVINDQLFEWANQLRLAGNEAAHNIKSEFTDIDAKDVLDFTIAILDFTYSFKDKFDKFKARLSKQENL